MANKESIRICFIAPKAYALFNPQVDVVIGGAEVDLYFLATELAKDPAYEVSFITADYGQPAEEMIDGVRIIAGMDFQHHVLRGALAFWRRLRETNAQMYLIKTISLGTFMTAFFCWFHKKTFLYRTAHATHCDGSYQRRHFVLGHIYNWALKTARYIFVQNQSDQADLSRTVGVNSIVIPNGHRLLDTSIHERETILWVGRSAPFKRPRLFLELALAFPAERFVMICQRATGDADYQALKERAHAQDNVTFIERVPFREGDRFFQQAKIFINTSDAEGFPNTFIQACMAGTAIASLNVNPDDFLGQHNCGYACNDRLEQLVDAVRNLLTDKTYQTMGQNGRDYMAQTHDVTNTCEQYKTWLART
ncbi:glycosyltransferase family 4 protein [Planctomycetota bacterium]